MVPWFEPQDFLQTLLPAEKRNITVDDVEYWREENYADPGYQVLSMEEIAEAVLVDKEEVVMTRLKMSEVRKSPHS